MVTSDEKPKKEELEEIWDELQDEHKERDGSDKSGKLFSVYKRLKVLEGEYMIITSVIRYLYSKEDEELIEYLSNLGYKVDKDNYEKSLDNIHNQASGILVKIKRLQKRLPKKSDKKGIDIDQAIYGYASMAEIAISDTNTVTMSQYYAIKELGEQRLKNIKKNGG